MSTMTEATFTAAMQAAVAKRGEGWTYPALPDGRSGFYTENCPTYSDANGDPTCLVGAAMFEAGMKVPDNSIVASALTVLGNEVPLVVAVAARCAQVYQDRRRPWGECFALYEAALVVAKRRRDECTLSMYVVMDVFHEARNMILEGKRQDAVSRAEATFASLMAEFEKASVSVTKAAMALDLDLNLSGFSIGGVIVDEGTPMFASSITCAPIFAPVQKKDHALVA